MAFDIRTAVAATLATGGDAPAIAYDGRWRSWAWLEAFRVRLDGVIAETGVDDSMVALVGRNRPAHLAAMAAQTASGRPTSMIYSAQSPTKIAADIAAVAAPIVLADPQDWTEETLAMAGRTGALAVAILDDADPIRVVQTPNGLSKSFLSRDPAVGFEMLSSGTTGAPKRIPLLWDTLSRATADARSAYVGTANDSAPQIMLHPIGNIAGVSYLLPIFAFEQRVVLMEKFDVTTWIDIVRTYRPARVSLPPAAVRMVLDSNAKRSDLASLDVVVSGGAKLEIELQVAFEERFGIPVLTAFGATEFAGVIANWSLDAYRRFGARKRGSAGQASANVMLRIVDRETWEPLAVGETGLLEAQVGRIGPGWIRTNDLASLDADGFLFIHGRADDAINRGGFKIVPDMVAAALKEHPLVCDAAVVAQAHSRLGEVPVAVVELEHGANVEPAALSDFLRDRLTAYQMPVEIRIVPSLPRNPSMKVALGEVKAMFDREQA